MKVKDLLIFIVGGLTGAGVMYFVTKKKNDKEVEKRVNEAIGVHGDEPIQNPVEEIAETVKEKVEETVETIEEKIEEAADILQPTVEEIKEKYADVVKKTDYAKASVSEKVTTMTDAVEEKAKEIVETAKKSSKKVKVPKKVTQDEFDATPESERRELWFYADNVLADIVTNEKLDPVEIMGATNFKNFKSTYDTIYIFNYATNLIYEITYSNSSYADIVGGDIHR